MSVDTSNQATNGKTAGQSELTMARIMMPDDANAWGDVHGGVIMKLVDDAAAAAAIRHSPGRAVTAAIDYMSFLHAVHVGDLVTAKAAVNDVGRTSMEVGVRVEAENMLTGEFHHTSSAYLVIVALDGNGQPLEVPPLVANTPEEKRRQAAARIRRSQRKVLVAALKQSAADHAAPAPVAPELLPPESGGTVSPS